MANGFVVSSFPRGMPYQLAASSKPKRIRRGFTPSEDQHLVEFLAKYDVGARASIFPYRALIQVGAF